MEVAGCGRERAGVVKARRDGAQLIRGTRFVVGNLDSTSANPSSATLRDRLNSDLLVF